jgi:hypothetical protein
MAFAKTFAKPSVKTHVKVRVKICAITKLHNKK